MILKLLCCIPEPVHEVLQLLQRTRKADVPLFSVSHFSVEGDVIKELVDSFQAVRFDVVVHAPVKIHEMRKVEARIAQQLTQSLLVLPIEPRKDLCAARVDVTLTQRASIATQMMFFFGGGKEKQIG